jgi:hypothetical protein
MPAPFYKRLTDWRAAHYNQHQIKIGGSNPLAPGGDVGSIKPKGGTSRNWRVPSAASVLRAGSIYVVLQLPHLVA